MRVRLGLEFAFSFDRNPCSASVGIAVQLRPEYASNKSYGDWGTIFGDPIIATAILDRLLHHSTTLNIRGESYRLKDRRRAGLLSRPEDQPPVLPPTAAATPTPGAREKRNRSL